MQIKSLFPASKIFRPLEVHKMNHQQRRWRPKLIIKQLERNRLVLNSLVPPELYKRNYKSIRKVVAPILLLPLVLLLKIQNYWKIMITKIIQKSTEKNLDPLLNFFYQPKKTKRKWIKRWPKLPRSKKLLQQKVIILKLEQIKI